MEREGERDGTAAEIREDLFSNSSIVTDMKLLVE
jgi:hypothetical protein